MEEKTWKNIIYLLITAVVSVASETADASMAPLHELTRRSTGQSLSYLPPDFPVGALKNATPMVCSDIISVPGIRLVQMTDAQMKAMFQDKGGNYVREYMAATLQEAHDNFPNMIMLSFPFQNTTQNYTVSVYDNYVAKQLVMDDMQKLMFYFLNKTSPNGQPAMGVKTMDLPTPPTSTSQSSVSPSSAPSNIKPLTPSTYAVPTPIFKSQTNRTKIYLKPTLPPITRVTSDKSSTYQHISSTTRPTSSVNAKTSYPHSIFSRKTTKFVKPASTSSYRHSDTASGSPTPQLSASTTTLIPEVANGIDQLHKYVLGSLINGLEPNLSSIEMDTIWHEANTTLHPSTLLGLTMTNQRKKREASDGSSTTEQYCQVKGAMTSDHKYVHLCSSCAATTHLADDFFPRYINEAVCKQSDTTCFNVGGIAHGECKQNMFVLNIMQRRRGHCAMVLHNGQKLAVDDWQLTPKAIRAACECTINKNSVFKQYVAAVG